MITLLYGLACTGAPDCESMESLERDQCLHERMRQIVDAPSAISTAGGIVDPIVRGAAITEWVDAHKNEVPRDDARALCDLLEGPDKGLCKRRLDAAHLQR